MDKDVVGFTDEQSRALEDKLKAVSREAVSAVHEHIDEGIKRAKNESRLWQVWMVALPVLLTVGLGFWVSSTQFNIQKQVEDNNRLLSTRLALREEFYRRRLTIYENACLHLANLRESLDLIEQSEPSNNEQAADNINAVDKLIKSEFLYMSDELVAELGDFWSLAVDRTRASGDDGAAIMEKITRQVLALEARMKSDLQTREIGQVP